MPRLYIDNDMARFTRKDMGSPIPIAAPRSVMIKLIPAPMITALMLPNT